MSSSLVMCLWSAPSGIVGIVVLEVDEAAVRAWDWDWATAEATAAAEATFDVIEGGKRGLQGEWEPAEVLEDAASGTPEEEYRSWLNCVRRRG